MRIRLNAIFRSWTPLGTVIVAFTAGIVLLYIVVLAGEQ